MELTDEHIGFREYLKRLIENAETGGKITIFTEDGQQMTIHGQVYMGTDFLEFQPGPSHRLVTIPFSKISHLMI